MLLSRAADMSRLIPGLPTFFFVVRDDREENQARTSASSLGRFMSGPDQRV